jgi:hypothetical protein
MGHQGLRFRLVAARAPTRPTSDSSVWVCRDAGFRKFLTTVHRWPHRFSDGLTDQYPIVPVRCIARRGFRSGGVRSHGPAAHSRRERTTRRALVTASCRPQRRGSDPLRVTVPSRGEPVALRFGPVLGEARSEIRDYAERGHAWPHRTSAACSRFAPTHRSTSGAISLLRSDCAGEPSPADAPAEARPEPWEVRAEHRLDQGHDAAVRLPSQLVRRRRV